MKNLRFKQVVLFTLIFILSGLIVLNGCQSEDNSVPVYQPVAEPPLEITIDQLISDYEADGDATLAKYKGERLLFSGVVVDKINTVFIDSANASTIYPVNDIIEFRPRYRTDTALVREGYVIDIIGEFYGVFGITNPYIVVDDCWIKIIEGDLGVGAYEDPDY